MPKASGSRSIFSELSGRRALVGLVDVCVGVVLLWGGLSKAVRPESVSAYTSQVLGMSLPGGNRSVLLLGAVEWGIAIGTLAGLRSARIASAMLLIIFTALLIFVRISGVELACPCLGGSTSTLLAIIRNGVLLFALGSAVAAHGAGHRIDLTRRV